MFKIWSPYGFNTDVDPFKIVRISSKGADRSWMKSASVSPLLQGILAGEFQNYKLAKDHTLVWLAPVAQSEWFSCNVNGDGFSKRACENFHETFLTGHNFREHDNQDPKKGFGRPVATAYNPEMGRIELLSDVDNTKNASVIEALENGRAVDWSMACRIDYDVCNVPECGNRATTPHGPGPKDASRQELDRPKPGYCKHAREMLGAILSDGHRVYVDNPHPYFFDCSQVATPAEVIARTMQFRKAASSKVVAGQSGADLAIAAGLETPLYITASLPSAFTRKAAIAQKLAEMEKRMPMEMTAWRSLAAGKPTISEESKKKIKEKTASETATLGAFRAQEIFLDLRTFSQVTKLASESTIEEAEKHLPVLFTKLADRQLLTDAANDGTYDNCPVSPGNSASVKLASELAPELSLAAHHVRTRLIETEESAPILASKNTPKIASVSADRLLRKYAAYVLSELTNCKDAGELNVRMPLTVLSRAVASN
jgi:hypothetical protein